MRLGHIFGLCFVTSVGIIMWKLPNTNACRGDEEILGTGSGGKNSTEGQSFQPIQPAVIAATLVHVCLSLPLFYIFFSRCMCARIYDYVSDMSLQSKILIGNKAHIAQFSAHQNVRFSACRTGHIHE